MDDYQQTRMKMQELMIEKLKKEAGATVVEIKDISYDAGYLYCLQYGNYTQIRDACCFSQVSWDETVAAAPSYEQGLVYVVRIMEQVLSNELSILHGIKLKCMTPEQYEAMEKK